MKQIVQYVNTGELKVDDVPIPALRSGGVLVECRYSLISSGTEKMTINVAKKSLVGKALERPDLVKQVLHKMKTDGIATTLQKVKTKLDAPIPLGYSCSGTVIAVAEEVGDFQVGDRVACAGMGYASHAEVVFVPRNLCIKMPDDLSFEEAAYVTLGSIAMQGIRVADVSLGENVMVIGLGLVGQIAVQILKSAGCRVLGVDVDPGKAALAAKLGADAVAARGRDDVKSIGDNFSRGRGMDAVVVTAATSSNDPVELAAEVLRDKGRVSIIGAVKMDIPRKPYYEKELDIRLSRSYGPGRYDTVYEEKGVDYPVGYVRWTERRNMENFLDLMSAGLVNTKDITTHTFDIADAISAYDLVEGKKSEPYLGILLKYPVNNAERSSSIVLKETTSCKSGKVRAAMIGAGNFGQGIILPNLAKNPNVELKAVATQNGINGKRAAERFGAAYATTNVDDLISDDSIDAVIIATRHDMHVPYAIKALNAGKHVFVEKPLALDSEQLDELVEAYNKSKCELVVDFNRRFSSLVIQLKERLASRKRPLLMSYRINAGFIPKESWIQDIKEGGGRIIGEGCHFIDLLQNICGAKPIDVYAAGSFCNNEQHMNKDNMIITIRFADGSVGNIIYASDGNSKLSKERLEIFGDGSSFVIDDFKSAVFMSNGKTENIKLKTQDKGHSAILSAFIGMAEGKGETPVPFDEAVSTTKATFAVLESLGLGTNIPM